MESHLDVKLDSLSILRNPLIIYKKLFVVENNGDLNSILLCCRHCMRGKRCKYNRNRKTKRKVMEREKCIILPVFMKSLQKEYKATVGFNIQNKKIRDDINGAVFILQFFLEIF